jgi:uncharacterized RDD family membrane protein YckC
MVPYGGFWWRVLAYIIDSVVLNIAMSLWGGIVGLGLTLPMHGLDVNDQAMTGTVMATTIGFTFLLNWLYSAVMECSRLQATLGKLAVGLVVTDLHGDRISFLRATGRYFAKFLSMIILGVGFLMAGWTQRKQGLHDIVAGSLVYKTRDPLQVETPQGVFT